MILNDFEYNMDIIMNLRMILFTMRSEYGSEVIASLHDIVVAEEREGFSLVEIVVVLEDIERSLGRPALLVVEHDAHRRRRAHRQQELRVLHPVDVIDDVPAVGLLVPAPLQHNPLELDLLHLGRGVEELQPHLPDLLPPVGLLGDHNVAPGAQL